MKVSEGLLLSKALMMIIIKFTGGNYLGFIGLEQS